MIIYLSSTVDPAVCSKEGGKEKKKKEHIIFVFSTHTIGGGDM